MSPKDPKICTTEITRLLSFLRVFFWVWGCFQDLPMLNLQASCNIVITPVSCPLFFRHSHVVPVFTLIPINNRSWARSSVNWTTRNVPFPTKDYLHSMCCHIWELIAERKSASGWNEHNSDFGFAVDDGIYFSTINPRLVLLKLLTTCLTDVLFAFPGTVGGPATFFLWWWV